MSIPYNYIAKKTIGFIVVFFSALTINFILPRLIPGNPAQLVYDTILKNGTSNINPSFLHQLDVEYGISHAPLYIQYFQYVVNLFHGNLGISLSFYPDPVSTILAGALPWTLFLVATSTVISFFIGNILGRYVGINRNTYKDVSIDLFTMFMASFPAFVLGFIILLIFGVDLGIFPIAGAYGVTTTPGFNLVFIVSVIYHSILPIVTIVFTSLGGWVLGMRNNIIPSLNSDFINFSENLGFRKNQITKIAYRNAILPNLTGFAMALGFSVTGVLLEEQIFSYPGVGLYMVTAIDSLDYPLIQGIFLMVILAVLAANFIVDLLYGILDPRTKQEGR
ncbi:MAG: ABC transporter permease [Candidatus Thermoplasmatota archaeon]|jgi:peptide/nickel transport system permease protein|nr:ABC transporter permease [Candidatus Thermoplasmatota archaeon]